MTCCSKPHSDMPTRIWHHMPPHDITHGQHLRICRYNTRLLQVLLHRDPAKRMTAAETLSHPYGLALLNGRVFARDHAGITRPYLRHLRLLLDAAAVKFRGSEMFSESKPCESR